MALVMFTIKLVTLAIKPLLPWSIIVSQFAYMSLDLIVAFLIFGRTATISCLQRVFKYDFKLFSNSNVAKEEFLIIFIYSASAVTSLFMIFEHLLRHPYLIGLDKNYSINSLFVYDLYPTIINGLTILLSTSLLVMTLDGFVIRRYQSFTKSSRVRGSSC